MEKEKTGGRGPREQEHRRRILRECAVPLALILILVSVFFYQRAHRDEPQRAAVSNSAEDSSITIKQTGTKKQGGLIETKQVIDVEIIRDGLRNMSFLVPEEYYFTEVISNKKIVSFVFPIASIPSAESAR